VAVSAATLLDRPGISNLGGERYFATGFEPLDTALVGGIRPRELVVVGGRPGVGKTIATLQWARWMAMAGTAVVYACYEHDERLLLGRLLALELRSLAGEEDDRVVAGARRTLERLSRGGAGLEVAAGHPLLQRTTARLRSYGDRLLLLRASGAATGVAELAALVDQHTDDEVVVFVDYLQKVPGREGAGDAERAAHTASRLKELAMTLDVAVVAVSATTHGGLTAPRARLGHLRGAEGIAYESDVVLILNEMSAAVSKAHRAYDPVRARLFAHRVLLSVEKNRRGPDALDLDFRKDFAYCRFDPEGSFTAERLVDDLLEEP
jgi:replicative DNA helicase